MSSRLELRGWCQQPEHPERGTLPAEHFTTELRPVVQPRGRSRDHGPVEHQPAQRIGFVLRDLQFERILRQQQARAQLGQRGHDQPFAPACKVDESPTTCVRAAFSGAVNASSSARMESCTASTGAEPGGGSRADSSQD